ncbi:methionyl-tRNA formyltransferase [Selenihalanaerobacter shriftii]|uniref:methionyl-tRNA formyltransferase n=1 Tax=Selenihalanaerobacter shriftii TaxID=142842 RepID=A0A1T4KM81_9FIRM|nr:methionyl-tRNA formyltransferase [Selenihalanaerobacter shriftii]SJZ43499.1 methionyl-tRNA formyltransferase [Selenihalanaerobacter shriftii]
MKILYMGDGKWGALCLKRLIKEKKELLGVVIRSNPSDKLVEDVAKENNLSIYSPNDVNGKSFVKNVYNLKPDLIVSMSYDQIIRKELIEIPSQGIINIHAGKLPYYRGRSPINWAIINGEEEIGLTVHYIDQGIDTGDIIIQEKVPININDNYATILRKVEELTPTILMQAINQIENGLVISKKHSHLEGIYLPRRCEGDEIINWNKVSKDVYNFIRALVPPGPGAVTFIDGKEIKVLDCELLDSPNFIGNPGQIIGTTNRGVKVKTKDNMVLVTKIKENNIVKKADLKIGTKLGINYLQRINSLEKRVERLEKKIANLTGR